MPAMMHHSRYRLLLLALVLVLVGLCLRGVASKTEVSTRSDVGRVENPMASATDQAGESAGQTRAGQARAGRSREGKALAKLRSLLKVRQGELAVIRIPLGALVAESGESLLGPPTGEDSPRILNVQDMEKFSKQLEARVSGDDSIDGVVKAADDSFEWRLSDLELEGRGLPNSQEETTLQLKFRLGERELVTTFTGRAGSMLVVHPGGKEDALLLVLGGEKSASGEGE